MPNNRLSSSVEMGFCALPRTGAGGTSEGRCPPGKSRQSTRLGGAAFSCRARNPGEGVLEVRRAADDAALREKASRSGAKISVISPIPWQEPEIPAPPGFSQNHVCVPFARFLCISGCSREVLPRQFREDMMQFIKAGFRLPSGGR